MITTASNSTMAILSGSNNIDSNPRFVNEFGSDNDPASGDENFRLLQQSPCIDVGNNAVVVLSVDLDGNDRILNDPYTAAKCSRR